MYCALRFWGSRGICAMSDHCHHGKGEHCQRDMAVPAMPGAGFIMVEAEFVLGGLETVFDRPAMSFDMNESVHACSCGTPRGEEGEIAVSNVTSNEDAAGPGPIRAVVERFRIEVRQFDIGPVVQPWPFGSVTGGKPLPCRAVE